jgi:hypothetical protein
MLFTNLSETLSNESKVKRVDPDQMAPMCELIWIYTVHTLDRFDKGKKKRKP